MQKFDAPAHDELVIAVPKISLDRTRQRSACRRPRRAEQLVEVPAIVSFSGLHQRAAEQIIDTPESSRFTPKTGFNGFVFFFARLCWCRG